MKNALSSLSLQQMQKALEIKQKIAALEKELSQILVPGKTIAAPTAAPAAVARSGKRTLSAAAKANISAAMRAKWAERRKAAAAKTSQPGIVLKPKTKH